MATQATSVTVTGTFTLTDSNGQTVFSFAPSFTTLSNTSDAAVLVLVKFYRWHKRHYC